MFNAIRRTKPDYTAFLNSAFVPRRAIPASNHTSKFTVGVVAVRKDQLNELVGLCQQIESEVACEYILNSARRAFADRRVKKPALLTLVHRTPELSGSQLRAVGG